MPVVLRNILPGSDLFSHSVTKAVSSALGRFTSVFGMGTGGSTPLEPPGSTFNGEEYAPFFTIWQGGIGGGWGKAHMRLPFNQRSHHSSRGRVAASVEVPACAGTTGYPPYLKRGRPGRLGKSGGGRRALCYNIGLREPSSNGPLAQLAEHRTFNPGVVGSIPTRPTFCHLEIRINISCRNGGVGRGHKFVDRRLTKTSGAGGSLADPEAIRTVRYEGRG